MNTTTAAVIILWSVTRWERAWWLRSQHTFARTPGCMLCLSSSSLLSLSERRSVVSDFLRPYGLHTRLLCPWNSPGKTSRVGCLSPLLFSQFSSVQLLSCVWLFVTLWIAARQASLSITNSWSSLKFMSIETVMPSNHLIFCCPLFLLPSIFPSIRVFR